MGKEVAFRGDAFARPEVYEALEERSVKYALRIPTNDSPERDIVELLPRPVGRPSQKPLIEFRVPLPSGQLEDGTPGGSEGGASRGGVIHTVGVHHPPTPTLPSRAVVRFYNKVYPEKAKVFNGSQTHRAKVKARSWDRVRRGNEA